MYPTKLYHREHGPAFVRSQDEFTELEAHKGIGWHTDPVAAARGEFVRPSEQAPEPTHPPLDMAPAADPIEEALKAEQARTDGEALNKAIDQLFGVDLHDIVLSRVEVSADSITRVDVTADGEPVTIQIDPPLIDQAAIQKLADQILAEHNARLDAQLVQGEEKK